MKLERSTQNTIWPRRNEFHVLTYAEEGFAPLNFWTRDTGITKQELVTFADLVNSRDESGSLSPRAPVSAVPRRLIRDQRDSEILCQSIENFYLVNSLTIKSSRLVLDFRTSEVAPFVKRAIELSLRSTDVNSLDELIWLFE